MAAAPAGRARASTASGKNVTVATPPPRAETGPATLGPPMTAAMRSEFLRAFQHADKSKAGTLSLHECQRLMSVLGFPVVIGQVRALARVGGVTDERLTGEQFVDLIMSKRVRQPTPDESTVASAMSALSGRADGMFRVGDLETLLTSVGEPLDAEELASLRTEAGLRPGGQVSAAHIVSAIMRAT